MEKRVEVLAEAQMISCRKETHFGGGVSIDNEGQFCIALVPRWGNWGATLEDGTKLIEGKVYKISIVIEE
jgi:hypothetical protein